MFGVVLWRDEQEQKAVIWCEDHGDLAFYRDTDGMSRLELDAGDWVQFDMTMERNQRFAHNPRVVSENVYPDLADMLEPAPASEPMPRHSPAPIDTNKAPVLEQGSAQIIPFTSVPAKRRRSVVPVQANRA